MKAISVAPLGRGWVIQVSVLSLDVRMTPWSCWRYSGEGLVTRFLMFVQMLRS